MSSLGGLKFHGTTPILPRTFTLLSMELHHSSTDLHYFAFELHQIDHGPTPIITPSTRGLATKRSLGSHCFPRNYTSKCFFPQNYTGAARRISTHLHSKTFPRNYTTRGEETDVPQNYT